MATGMAAVLAGVGALVLARSSSERWFARVVFAVLLVSCGAAAINAALFPLPSPRHSGGAMGAGLFLVPFAFFVDAMHAPRKRAHAVASVLNMVVFGSTGIAISGHAGIDQLRWQGALQRVLALTCFVPLGWWCWNERRAAGASAPVEIGLEAEA